MTMTRPDRNCAVVAALAFAAMTVLPCVAARKSFGRLEPVVESAELKVNLGKYMLKAGRFIIDDLPPMERGRAVPQELQYLIYKPDRGRLPKVPLVVYLPGVGEIGESLDRQFHEPAVFRAVTSGSFQRRHPCYLLALSPPLSARTLLDGLPGKPSPVQTLLAAAIREIAAAQKAPSVDTERIYLTGLSYGGGGVYGLMTSFPGMFAAGVPVATFPPPPSFITGPLRIWHIYNDGDYARAGLDRALLNPFAEAVSQAGGIFKVGTFPSGGHNAWTAAWGEDAVWEWTFGQSLPATGRRGRAHGKPPDKDVAVTTAHSDIVSLSGHEVFRAVDGLDGTWFESDGPVRKGAALAVDFSVPVRKRILISRHDDGNAALQPPLLVETSRNGKTWTRAGVMPVKAGQWTLRPPSAIRGLRLSAVGDSDVPLRIREIRIVDQ